MTGRIKKAKKQGELDALAFNVLSSFRHQGAMQWVDWYETTTARRGERGLSTRTFSDVVKRLMANGQVQKDKDDCYQAVYDAVEDADDRTDVVNEPMDILLTVENSSAVKTEQFRKALSKVLLKAGNGNADIADIALQQLTEIEA